MSRGQDVTDVLTALDYATEKGLVDASKVAVLGGSHGGFLTTHLVGQVQYCQDNFFNTVIPYFITCSYTCKLSYFNERMLGLLITMIITC